MKEVKFNYCIPREYKNKEGNIDYCLCKGGEKMSIATISDIQTHCDTTKPKNAQPWCQVFSNGYRVTNDNIDWNDWNGITFSDIDSKYFYNYAQRFNVQALLNMLHDNAEMLYPYNYYGCYITPSGLGYRILWYWDCERTETNFLKCALLTEKYTRELFYSLGEQGKQIIDFSYNGRKVLDSCSKSIKQGLYITKSDIVYSCLTDDRCYGAANIEDISISEIYQFDNSFALNDDVKQCDFTKIISCNDVNTDTIHYFPHHHRRCIYEALIVLYKDKTRVDEQWKRIVQMLPVDDGSGHGHTKQFFIEEPDKNSWYKRFNTKTAHSLHWLDDFGYTYEDKSEYIYYRHFRKSWKKHVFNVACNRYIEMHPGETTVDELHKHLLFDDIFNDVRDIDELRKSYYKQRWSRNEFKFLCNGYEIAKDAVTYKMYADFYYRDENNLPIIKYNILEDDILTIGYWPETNKIQYHTLKFNDEYTHWSNNDEFSNKAVKEKMRDCISKYATRWHSFHSIKDYLNSLDLSIADENLLETWAIRYFKADDTKSVREMSRNFFIAAVKKMMIEDPTKFVFQHMMFLQGPTGCGKTFFLVNMFTIDGHSYILNRIDPNADDAKIGPLIAKNWLIQFGESEGLTRASVNAQKEFVDRVNLGMKYQKKYENEQTTVYPRIVVCRTSNDDTLFNDVSINEGDRRNWLIVCNCEAMSCDDTLKKTIRDERDILWATAYKMYLDNPNIDLELSPEAFKQLAQTQEQFKLIKNDDISEIYDDVFDRLYLTNNKGHIQDEYAFNKMLERSDNSLKNKDPYIAELLDTHYYCQDKKINVIPASWLKNYIVKKYGVSTFKLFRDYLKKQKWEFMNYRYNDKVMKCWCK